MQTVMDGAEDRPAKVEALERFDFYETAKDFFAVVRTCDPGAYGCFNFTKGVC